MQHLGPCKKNGDCPSQDVCCFPPDATSLTLGYCESPSVCTSATSNWKYEPRSVLSGWSDAQKIGVGLAAAAAVAVLGRHQGWW